MFKLTGTNNSLATHEIHLFFGPVYVGRDDLTDQEEKATPEWQQFHAAAEFYKQTVAKFNEEQLPKLRLRDDREELGTEQAVHSVMKAPVLTLVFRDGKGEKPVTVCQCARYVRCNSIDKLRAICAEEAAWFKAQGLAEIRQKIEASCGGIREIPEQAADTVNHPGCYFEFHIKVQREDAAKKPELITEEEEKELRTAADLLSSSLKIPIPLSFNREKNDDNKDNGGCQRFLNARFRSMGMAEIKPLLSRIKDSINNMPPSKSGLRYRHIKVIKEYVWFDTNKEMDHGWIDYTPEEQAALDSGLAAKTAN